jgi:hypothetical protein
MKPAGMRLARNVASQGAKSGMRDPRRRTVEGVEFPSGLLQTRCAVTTPAILGRWISRNSSSSQMVPSVHT